MSRWKALDTWDNDVPGLSDQQLLERLDLARNYIEPLAVLDDCFDTLEYRQNPTEEQLDQRTQAAASELVSLADELTGFA